MTSPEETETALENRTAELEAIYESAPVMMCALDAGRRILYANRAFTDFTGVFQDELRLGRACGLFGCINALDTPEECGFGANCSDCRLRTAIEETIRTGRSHRDVEYRGTWTRDGRTRQVALRGSTALVRAGGEPRLLLCLQDVTARVAAEAALVESEERYRTFFENSAEGIFRTFPDGRFLQVNPAAARMTGFGSPEELVAAVNEGRFQPWVDPLARRRYVSLLESQGEVSCFEAEWRRRDGTTIWLSINATAPRDAGGHTVRFEATAVDITAIRQARQALATQARFLQTLIDAMPFPVYFKDRSGAYLGCNRTFETAMGRTREQIVGRTVFDIFPHASAVRAHELDKALLARPGVQFYESVLETPAGPAGEVLFQKATFQGPDGTVAGIIGSVVDVADLKRAESDVRRLNDELESRVRERTDELTVANKELESFSYSVSHDLRAPLRAIASFAQLVHAEAGGLLPERSREHLERVIAAAGKMSRLIDALLGLSRISRREMKPQPVDLTAFAREIAQDLLVHDSGRKVDVVVADGLRAEGDPELLRLVLRNLLENALKFTSRRDSVRIEVGSTFASSAEDRTGSEPRPQRRAFFVRDDGAGFDMRYADKLFGPFQRLHAEAEFPGSGIGLASAQRVIHRHGGSIWADSTPGGGATFFFTLGAAGA